MSDIDIGAVLVNALVNRITELSWLLQCAERDAEEREKWDRLMESERDELRRKNAVLEDKVDRLVDDIRQAVGLEPDDD